MGKYLLVWLPMILLAVVNGALRELTYGKHVAELRAHQLSTITAIILFGVYLWFAFRRWPPPSAGRAWGIGAMFVGLTVAFEFSFGHFAAGHSWSRLLHDYNPAAGRVWGLVLLFLSVAPYLCFRLQR